MFEIFALLALILALVSMNRTSRFDAQLRKLREEIQLLRNELAQARSGAPLQQQAPSAESASEESAEVRLHVEAEQTVGTDVDAVPSGNWAASARPPVETVQAGTDSTVPQRQSLEQRLASQWFVWLGGAAIALGGLLFVKYAHDQGLIPPTLRVIVGLAVAGALVFAGEWLRKKQDPQISSYVPAALSAAGIVIAFGVIYAAYALYQILSPTLCFPLLVAVGIGAIVLARWQGPLIAALGLLGAFVAPMLVPSDNPSAVGFFIYLTVLTLFCLYELRERNWWWLGYAAIAGGTIWSLLWAYSGAAADTPGLIPPGVFAFALGAGSLLLPRGKAVLSDAYGSLADIAKARPPLHIAMAGVGAGLLVLAAFVIAYGHKSPSLILFLLGIAAVTAITWLKTGTSYAALAAAIVSWLVFMAWPEVGFYEPAFDERGFWVTVPGLVEPPRFVKWILIAGALHLVAGAVGLFRFKSVQWAMLAAFAGFAFVFGAWAKADFVMSDMNWALLGAGATAVMCALLWHVQEATLPPRFMSVDALLVGIAFSLLFVVDRLFDGVAQTIVTAIIAAAFAYASRIVPARSIGAIASAVATLAAARLFVTRDLYLEQTTLAFGHHWPIYGYGVPAALFWMGSRWLSREHWPKWSIALEGLSLGLLISLVSVELRTLISGRPSGSFTLLEAGAQACAWLGAAFGLAYRQQQFSGFISRWGATALIAGATALLVIGLVFNPAVTTVTIDGGLVLNALTMAYLLPVPILALLAPRLEGLRLAWARSPMGVLALVLLLTFVTVQIMRIFQGAILERGFASDAESYTVSTAWVLLGLAIFVAGIRINRQTIRYGGLAILVAAVLKVFILDFSDLSGLWRIASLIGLGLCLVGIGWLYTRFVLKPSTGPTLDPAPQSGQG